MLKLLCSEDRAGLSARILNEICEKAQNGVGGLILIVPEQYSHEAERALCAVGGDSISRFAEVLSFSRLAQRLFSIYGGTCEEYLDGGGHFLTVCRAADQVKSRLKYFAPVLGKADFLQQLGTVLEEFLTDCITPENLQQAAAHQQGQFAQKLTELAVLYESYLSVTSGSRPHPVSRLHRLQELLAAENYCADKCFYFDGFSDFTAIEQQIVEQILRRCENVTCALRTDGSDLAPFQTVTQTEKWLRMTAARLNVATEKEVLPISENRAEPIRKMISELFRSRLAPYAEKTEAICLHTAEDLYGECGFCAQKVRELLNRGYRYRDICIAAADSAYFAPLGNLLKKAAMPAYIVQSTDILQTPLFAALLSCLRACERMDYENVMAYIKSSLSPLAADAACRLEQYAFIWNVRGSGWEKPFTMHPKGYGIEWEEEHQKELSELETWREAAIAPLIQLRHGLREAENVLAMLVCLRDFIEDVGLCETLQEQEEKNLLAGERQRAQQVHQLYDALLAAMEQTAQILGDMVMPEEQFVQIFSMLLGQYRISTIPSSVDQLQIGPIDAFRHKTAKVLIVLGAADGALPAFSQKGGILTDEERKTLLAAGLSLAPAELDRFAREMGDVHAALSTPREILMLSFHGQSPSYLFEKLEGMFPDCKKTTQIDLCYAPDAVSAAASACACGTEKAVTSAVVLQAMRDLEQKARYALTPISAQTVQGLYGKTVSLSASKIDVFTGCRFAFFVNYGLKAEPWKQVSFDAPVFGTFVHYVLECTVRDVMAVGGFQAADDEQVLAIAEHHAQEYKAKNLSDMDSRAERYGYLFSRNLQELREVVLDLARELRLSRFYAADEELSFASDGILPPIEVQGKRGKSRITGYIDRVDLYEEDGQYYCRVVDYKTGGKDFDYADLQKGHGLQMLIYLFALKNSGKAYYGKPVIPAGVLYVPAKTDYVSCDANADAEKIESEHLAKRRRKGLVLGEEEILYAMEQQDKPDYLPVKVTKDGFAGDIASRRQLALLDEFVQTSLQRLTDEIYGGRLTPDPIRRGRDEGACKFCKFESICHKDFLRHDYRDIKKIKAEDFWSALEGGEQNG